MAAEPAGAGGGGTIIMLTFDAKWLKKASKSAGAEEFVDLYPEASGVTWEYFDDNRAYVAATLKDD